MPEKRKRSSWKTTQPPKRKQKPVRLRYQNGEGVVQTGDFVWSDSENTWSEVCNGPDGIALYADDGYKVLGWKEPSPSKRQTEVQDMSGFGLGGSGALFARSLRDRRR